MAITLRLPVELMARAQRYAEGLGLSFNGLVAVALSDYLDSRDGGARVAAAYVTGVEAPRPAGPAVMTGPGRLNTLPASPAGQKVPKGAAAAELRRLGQERHNLEVERRKLEKAKSRG